MRDVFKVVLLSALTAAVVQVIFAPLVHRFHGYPTEPTGVPVASAVGKPPQAGIAGGPQPAPPPAVPATPTAPNIEGLDVDDARSRFRAQGIAIIEEGHREAEQAEPGTILQQRPQPGAPMPVREIRVITAKAPKGTPIPAVTGRPGAEAEAVLRDAGFEVAVERARTDGAAPGTVVEQHPPQGTRLPRGGRVRIVVAEAAGVEVPKLVRKRLSRARKILEENGLAVGTVRQVEDPELGGGTVLRQDPKPGAKVPPGTEVDLTVVAPD